MASSFIGYGKHVPQNISLVATIAGVKASVSSKSCRRAPGFSAPNKSGNRSTAARKPPSYPCKVGFACMFFVNLRKFFLFFAICSDNSDFGTRPVYLSGPAHPVFLVQVGRLNGKGVLNNIFSPHGSTDMLAKGIFGFFSLMTQSFLSH